MACIFVFLFVLYFLVNFFNTTTKVPGSTLEQPSKAEVSMCVDIFLFLFCVIPHLFLSVIL